jgi:ubiquinone/menaquinone biosynthesis C-methylase UbiE
MNWLTERVNIPELIDGDSLNDWERLEALGQLPRVNRWLGGARVVIKELRRIAASLTTRDRVRTLDVGCGAADIPQAIGRWAAAKRLRFTIVGLERDAATIELAARRANPETSVLLVRGDGLRLPFADQSFDIAMASMFCHHFYRDELQQILREMARVASEAVIINDLHRHWAALWGYRAFSHLFLRGHVIRYDGAISVRRGFRPNELRQLAAHFPDFSWTVNRRLMFRLCLVGRRLKRGT